MKKNSHTHANRTIDDPLLAMAGQCAIELINEEVNAALENIDWAALQDINLDDWFERTILAQTKGKKPIKRSMPRRILHYAAFILLFVILTAVLIVATYEPVRAAFLRFFVERFPQYSEYSIRLDEDEAEADMAYNKPGYIPEGFRLTQSQDRPDSRFISWVNDATGQFITYSQTKDESSIMLDTENAIIHQTIINGISAEVIEKDNVTTVQFFHGDICYAVVTDLPYPECIRIAEGIIGNVVQGFGPCIVYCLLNHPKYV